jgi:RNA-binding protein NOB1
MSGWLAAAKADAPVASAPRVPEAEAGKTKVVVDANAIVKGIRLERLAEEAVTIPEVLREIKDRQARHTLATLPFELKVRDPDEESIKAVRRFARLTGDLGALSDPDVRCIALHLTLEKEAHGLAHVRSEPPPLVLSKHKHNKQTKQPGWDYVPDTDAWAELDAMNAEAERSAEEVASRMASASLAEAPEKPPPLPATALLALEMKERLEKKRAKERETRALLGEDKGAETAEAAEGDEKNDDDDDDDDGGLGAERFAHDANPPREARGAPERGGGKGGGGKGIRSGFT